MALNPALDVPGDPLIFERKRIGLVMGALATGSRERVIFRLAERLAERGAAVDILVPGPPEDLRRQVPPSVNLLDIGPGLLRSFPNMIRLALAPPAITAYLKTSSPDIVMTLSIPPGLATLIAKRLAGGGTAVILRQSNVIRIKGSARYGHVNARLRDRPIKWLYPSADAFIAVSNGVADNLGQLIGIDARQIRPIANGIFFDDILEKSSMPVHHPWLAERRADNDPDVIVAVGRLVEKKDYPTLFKALRELRRKRPARLIVLGEGRMRSSLEALAASLGLEDAIDMPGRVDNPFAYLSRASLYVLSSTFEGMPSALIEALACGCPVVSTDCPSGPSEILANGDFGRLVPVGDVQKLAEAMEATLSAPPSAERQRARSREFSAERTIDGYLDVFAELLSRRRFET